MGVRTFLHKLIDTWGRFSDRSYWTYRGLPPQENPDETLSDEYFDIANNPHIITGMQYSDVSYLFVSAKGLQEKDTGASFPAQVIFTTPELASQEVLDLVAWQFDEEFFGGFQEVIRSTDDVCKSYGRAILEYEWYIKESEPFQGKAFVRQVYARDPEPYYFDIDGKPGIYRDDGISNLKRMNPNNFQSYAYNPLFNNPYGRSINFTLKPWIETFNKVFDYWRHALEKAGLGSWGASYPNAWLSDDAKATAQRATLEEAIKKIAAGTWSIYPEGAHVENFKLQMEAQAFLDWYTSFCEVVSLIYTGTTTALKEAEYGSKAAKESTDVRSRSNIEKFNAARVSNFWTWWFIPVLCDVNFEPGVVKSYPSLQLIKPELITPVTPKDQAIMGGQDEVGADQETIEVISSQEKQQQIQEPAEFAEGETAAPDAVSVPTPLPASHERFPNPDPLPEPYYQVLEYARQALNDIQVKEYGDVQPGEAAQTFTVKRLRNYTTDMLPVLTDLKTALEVTLDAATEADAWEDYYDLAVDIFKRNGINMDTAIRDDLNVSFRQARQNAFAGGQLLQAQSDPAVVGMRIVNDPKVVDHHVEHTFWDGIVIPKDHKELQAGGRLRIPMDFGCLCYYEPVYDLSAVTPEQEWPGVYPGRTYRLYTQPKEK